MRRGFVLPFVVVAIGAAGVLAFAFTGDALRAARAVLASGRGDDAGHLADAAMAAALARWTDDSSWVGAPGTGVLAAVTVGGVPVPIRWERHQPLIATLRVMHAERPERRWDWSRRDHWRAVWLEPPPLPVPAAIATNGALQGALGVHIAGGDVALPGSACGARRDTLGVPPVAASAVTGSGGGGWPSAPQPLAPPTSLLADVQTAMAVVAARTPARASGPTPVTLPVTTGWQALRLRGDRLAVVGPTRWQGLLVAEGDLTLAGSIDVTGLLVVLGRLDASAAQLTVQGALVAVDTSARGVTLGGASRITFDRCAVEMALATVARPSLAPFALWHSLPY
jgi:hypothetical protein